MKRLIAHRGNTNGPIPARENTVGYITEALDAGYDVEVDVWCSDSGFYLGHDAPSHEVDLEFLLQEGLWLHCKNVAALGFLSMYPHANAFMHDNGVIITRNGYLWTAPDCDLTSRSVAVMPELAKSDWDISIAHTLCSDYVDFFRTI